MNTNKHEFTNYIKSIYPNMIEDYWFSNGELHFYKDAKHAETSESYACIKHNGKFEILEDF